MAEMPIYSNGPVQITNRRAIIGSKTYAMRNISSVQVGITRPLIKLGAFLAVVGLALLIAGASAGAGLVIVGLLLLAGGIALIVYDLRKPVCVVVMASTGGEVHALTSRDRPLIETVVQKMNDAIASGV